MGKTNPLNDDDLAVKNPNGNETVVHRSPREILDEIGRRIVERDPFGIGRAAYPSRARQTPQ